jgi:hypothetical protein
MESEDVSTDDGGQRYPGARSRYPTELKKPGFKLWKVYERFSDEPVLFTGYSPRLNRTRIHFDPRPVLRATPVLAVFKRREYSSRVDSPNSGACEQGDQKGMPPATSSGRQCKAIC